MELDMKKWVNNASHYLSKVERKTLLWTNENPFSQFAAQTLLTQGELEDYDIVEIESYIYITNSSNRQTTIPITVHMNETGCMQSGAFGGSNYASGVFWFATRKVTPSSSGIVFDNAYGGYPNNNWAMRNDMCIPYRIYGIKIGSGTEDVEGRGTSDYNLLIHKPSINGVTLVEGLSSDDLNIGDTSHEEMSQAEFDILPEAEKDDGTVYFITDGISKNIFLDDNTPIGMIAPYGGTVDPSYWLICDGRAVSRTAYSELFLVIGTTYGAGDGSTTFNIPDLRGNVAVGASATYGLGDTGGEEKHTLTVNEMPSHTHTTGIQGNSAGAMNSGTTSAQVLFNQSAGVNTTATGGGQAHNNMQPYVVTNYIIKAKSALSENQSQLDFFYPVGSYYETSDATFNPNIRWGGTWEMDGVVDDYIIDEGVDGIWMYKKWASGFSECWGTHSVTLTHYATSGGFYGYNTSVYFPEGLFYNRPVATYNCLVDSAFSIAAANLGLTNEKINLYALSNASGSQATVWDIEAKGRWKELNINNRYIWHRVV